MKKLLRKTVYLKDSILKGIKSLIPYHKRDYANKYHTEKEFQYDLDSENVRVKQKSLVAYVLGKVPREITNKKAAYYRQWIKALPIIENSDDIAILTRKDL